METADELNMNKLLLYIPRFAQTIKVTPFVRDWVFKDPSHIIITSVTTSVIVFRNWTLEFTMLARCLQYNPILDSTFVTILQVLGSSNWIVHTLTPFLGRNFYYLCFLLHSLRKSLDFKEGTGRDEAPKFYVTYFDMCCQMYVYIYIYEFSVNILLISSSGMFFSSFL